MTEYIFWMVEINKTHECEIRYKHNTQYTPFWRNKHNRYTQTLATSQKKILRYEN